MLATAVGTLSPPFLSLPLLSPLPPFHTHHPFLSLVLPVVASITPGFPHGVFPVSELLCISLMMRLWPALRVYSIAASSVFSVPVWRHIMCWTGARPATRHWFRWLLARGSVSLVPGGIAEMFLWEAGREVIKARDRKGFVRLAVEAGVPLVPVYHFGNSQLFRCAAGGPVGALPMVLSVVRVCVCECIF